MMLKQAVILGAAVMAAASCGKVEAPTEKVVESAPAQKVLVAYYSWSGNTRAAAEYIQKATNGVLFEIKPKTAYSSDYKACVDQARIECKAKTTPELEQNVENLNDYDVIFIGSPNWCGTMAPPVRTFITQNDFTGKTIIPFFTHGGGGMQNCERDVAELCSKGNVLKAGAFSGSSIKDREKDIQAFAQSSVTK